MTTYQTSIVAGVFSSELEARKAVDMLRNAQFERDQLGVAMRNGGMATESLSNDFVNLGVPRDRANFYEHEFKDGKIIVSVRPDGREEEARTILNNNGAYDYDAATSAAQVVTEAPDSDQSASEAQAAQPEETAPPVQQPIEEERPEHDTIQEATEHTSSEDTHTQADAVEHATSEPTVEDAHDSSQIDDSQTHVAEPAADSSADDGHNHA
jgi:hypothetical protein